MANACPTLALIAQGGTGYRTPHMRWIGSVLLIGFGQSEPLRRCDEV